MRLLPLVSAAAALCLAYAADAVEAENGRGDSGAPTQSHTGSLLQQWLATGDPSHFSVAFINSITMIIATELGDKTFCIAAVMAMKYNRIAVFAGGIGALIVMTILSVGIGVALPTVLPKTYTHYAAAGLFGYFGIKLLREARAMAAGGEEGGGELEEAEEIAASLRLPGGARSDKKADKESAAGEDPESATIRGDMHPSPSSGSLVARRGADIEAGVTSPEAEDPRGRSAASKRAAANIAQTAGTAGTLAAMWFLFVKDWAVFTQSFSITFLAEWGDRSQIATIAMAAAQNPYGVCMGAFVGHSLCTGLAVVGGRLLASRISERTVAFVGGLLFLVFAVHSLIVGPDVDE